VRRSEASEDELSSSDAPWLLGKRRRGAERVQELEEKPNSPRSKRRQKQFRRDVALGRTSPRKTF